MFGKQFYFRKKILIKTFFAVFAVEAIFFMTIFFQVPFSDFFAAILPRAIVDSTNELRQKNELGSLETNSLLEQAASLKAEDMAKKGYFAHTSPEGITPWHWFDEVGYDFVYAGENLAVNFFESSDIQEAWLNSPKHRANIVNKNYTQIGIAKADGMYKGKEATFVVELFGKPRNNLSKTATIVIGNEINFSNSVQEEVLGAEAIRYTSFFSQFFSSIKTTIIFILLFFTLSCGISLTIKFFLKKKFKFSQIAINGIMFLITVIVAITFNHLILQLVGSV